jgi:hypothetical protein
MPTIQNDQHDTRCPAVTTATFDDETGVIEVVRCDREGGDGHTLHGHSTPIDDDGMAVTFTWYSPQSERRKGRLEWG